jgi:hypothetical protein
MVVQNEEPVVPQCLHMVCYHSELMDLANYLHQIIQFAYIQ